MGSFEQYQFPLFLTQSRIEYLSAQRTWRPLSKFLVRVPPRKPTCVWMPRFSETVEPWKIYDFYKSRPRRLRGWIVHESFIMHEIIADEQFQVAPLTNASAAAVRFHARGRQRTDVSRRIAFETRGHGFLVKSVNHWGKRGFLYEPRIPPFLSSDSKENDSFVRPRK